MSPKIACTGGCRIAFVVFIRLFCTVCFQMCPQIACTRGYIITLVAFVWLFSTMCFQMSPQIACIRGCIVTLVALVWFDGVVSLFHKAILQTQVFIFKSLFHFQNVNEYSLCSAWWCLQTEANLSFLEVFGLRGQILKVKGSTHFLGTFKSVFPGKSAF